MANSLVVKGTVATLITLGTGTGIAVGVTSAPPADSKVEHLDSLDVVSERSNNNLLTGSEYLENRVNGENLRVRGGSETERPREEAARVYKTLEDYSFKLFGPDCSIGTGWILDYQLSDNSEEYPTTWYIATNAYVIQNYRFSENYYDQILPWGNTKETKEKRKNSQNWLDQLKTLQLDVNVHNKCESPTEIWLSRYEYV